MIQRFIRFLLNMTTSSRKKRYRSEKAEFISSHAIFYKILGKDKSQKQILKSEQSQNTKDE